MLFDDTRLDDLASLTTHDQLFRPLAESGPQLRRAGLAAEPLLTHPVLAGERPRAIVACGPEARLLRAVLEPTCPVPFVAWAGDRLPAWTGALDVVIVLDPVGNQPSPLVTAALQRGSRLLVAGPADSVLADQAASRDTVLLPANESLTSAVLVLAALAQLGIGPPVSVGAVAEGLDRVAIDCATARGLAVNPAKRLALEWADTRPLVWGGSVLAARAGRRIAEAIRSATGELALAADAAELLPLLDRAEPRDVFADPVEVRCDPPMSLIVVGTENEVAPAAPALLAAARAGGIRVSQVLADDEDVLVRYCSWLGTGRFAAAYLRLGLM